MKMSNVLNCSEYFKVRPGKDVMVDKASIMYINLRK